MQTVWTKLAPPSQTGKPWWVILNYRCQLAIGQDLKPVALLVEVQSPEIRQSEWKKFVLVESTELGKILTGQEEDPE